MKMTDFFFCYSTNLNDFLKQNGQRYICAGLHSTTRCKFYLFQRTDELNALLTRYKEDGKAVGK